MGHCYDNNTTYPDKTSAGVFCFEEKSVRYKIKKRVACFFNALNRWNPTTYTLIPDWPTRFWFLARLQNILMKFSPTRINQEVQYAWHWMNRTGVRTVWCSRLLLICHHFFYSLVYISACGLVEQSVCGLVEQCRTHDR